MDQLTHTTFDVRLDWVAQYRIASFPSREELSETMLASARTTPPKVRAMRAPRAFGGLPLPCWSTF